MSNLYGINEAVTQGNALSDSVMSFNAQARNINEERGRDAKLQDKIQKGKYSANEFKTEGMGGFEGLMGLSGAISHTSKAMNQAKSLGRDMSYFSPAGQASLTNVKIAQQRNFLSQLSKGKMN